MRGLRVFLTLLLTLPAATAASPADWWAMHYMDGGHYAVVVHPRDPNVLYLTWDTIVSFDGGETWEGLAGTWEGAPSTWAPLARRVRTAQEFSPDPSDPLTVYWITWGDAEDPSKRLVRVTWSGGPHQEVLGDLSTFDGGIPSSVLVHPLQPQTLYVGTTKGELFCSDDRGGTWRPLYPPDPEAPPGASGIYLIVVPPPAPSTIYINDPGDHPGLCRSFDEGQTWERLALDLEQRSLTSLGATGQDPQLLYLVAAGCRGCASYGAVYRSQDAGTTWESLLQSYWPRAILGGSIRVLTGDPEDPARVAVAANEGVYLTEDGGKTWRFLELPISGLRGEYEAYSVAIQATHPKRLLVTVVDALFALELPVGPSPVSPSTWGRIKAPLLPVLPPTSK